MNNLKATEYQIKVAAQLGLDVGDETIAVAAAKIGDIVGPALDERDLVRTPTERQIALARSLGVDVSHDSFRVASARIADALRTKDLKALAELQLKPGDKVGTRETYVADGQTHNYIREWTVSSVSRYGRVYFKGGNGYGAWAGQLQKL